MPLTDRGYDAEPSIPDRAVDTVEETKVKVEQTKNRLKEFGAAVAEKLNRNRYAGDSSPESAGSLRDRSDNLSILSIDPTVSDVTHSAAEKLKATAGYIGRNDLNSMAFDVEGLIRKNCGVSMLIALGLGFVLGRTLNDRLRL